MNKTLFIRTDLLTHEIMEKRKKQTTTTKKTKRYPDWKGRKLSLFTDGYQMIVYVEDC